jgi:PAP2 superfamily
MIPEALGEPRREPGNGLVACAPVALAPVTKRRRAGHLPLWGEIGLFLGLTVVYEWLRDLVAPASPAAALQHAQSVVSGEKKLSLFVEPELQRWIADVPGGENLVSWLYTVAHTPGFILFFAWLWWRHRERYGFVRFWFWLAHAFAVVVFWLWPLAPPRLAGLGLADPTQKTLELGGATSWFQPFRNEYAAMPSLHVGYTFFFALVITMIGLTWWRFAAWVWPAAILIVVMATANHYWLDAVGGAAVMTAALATAFAANRVFGWGWRLPWEHTR